MRVIRHSFRTFKFRQKKCRRVARIRHNEKVSLTKQVIFIYELSATSLQPS